MHFFLLRFGVSDSLVETFSFRRAPLCYRLSGTIETPFQASKYGDSDGRW